MALQLKVACLFVVFLSWTAINVAIDCSVYSDFDSCSSASHCNWQAGGETARCRCAAEIELDLMITVSTSAYIGSDHFELLVRPFLSNLTETGLNSGTTRVGWNIFSDSVRASNLTYSSYSDLSSFVSNIHFDGGVADLSLALENTLSAFASSTPTARKLNVILMGSNAYTQTHTLEVCAYASKLKQLGIQVVYVGMGTSWSAARVTCLVEHDHDVLVIPSYTQGEFLAALSVLMEYTCPSQYQVKITEVKPLVSSSSVRFIEFVNFGVPIPSTVVLTLSGLVSGSITLPTPGIAQGQYVVIYDADDAASGSLSCSDCTRSTYCSVDTATSLCEEALYIACGRANTCSFETLSSWSVSIAVAADTLDSIRYDNTDDYWPVLSAEFSYSLAFLGYNNAYGANFVRSCTKQGTPGAATLATCSNTELQCVNDEQCQLSGDHTAVCSSQQCLCGVSGGFYQSRAGCQRIPPPMVCTAFVIKNDTQRYTKFVISEAAIDADDVYAITNFDANGVDYTRSDRARVKTETIYSFEAALEEKRIAGYAQTVLTSDDGSKSWSSPAWSTNCTIETPLPTMSPTQTPTGAPTFAPTQTPTSAPTWQTPKIFISGDFCELDRCECFEKGTDCCLSDAANCTSHEVAVTATADRGFLVYNAFKVFPENYPFAVRIEWNVVEERTFSSNNESQRIEGVYSGLRVSPLNGTAWINGSAFVNLPFWVNQSEVVCADNTTECVTQWTHDTSLRTLFTFAAQACIGVEDECELIYPQRLQIVVGRSIEDVVIGVGGTNDKFPMWAWFVLAGGLLFATLLGFLMYRYWFKGRRQSDEYHLLADDIEFQKRVNDEDVNDQLQNLDIGFNPLAAGMPTPDTEADPITAERQQRELRAINDVVEPAAVKEVFKEEMGQRGGLKYNANQ